MSHHPQPQRRSTAPLAGFGRVSALRSGSTLQSIPELSATGSSRRPSGSNISGRSLASATASSSSIPPPSKPSKTVAAPPAKSAQRTTKTSQKLVVLPSEPQTAPLPEGLRPGAEDDERLGPPTSSAARAHHHRHHEDHSEGEKMTKDHRQRAGYRRLTAYCVADGFRLKLLLAYLKREHGITPRVFDEAVYGLYHLPLLPGYGPNVNVRSSAAPKSPEGGSILTHLSDAEDMGYDGTYFAPSISPEQFSLLDGYISGSPPVSRKIRPSDGLEYEAEPLTDVENALLLDAPQAGALRSTPITPRSPTTTTSRPSRKNKKEEDRIAELIVFDYGVVVFFGFEERQERDVLEDFDRAMISVKPRPEDKWEVESCHYVYDPSVASPRIYNDFFTFKTHSHLLKLSISHALAQSVLLGVYEDTTQTVLSSPQIMAIPKSLATTGELRLGRSEALRITGKLFKLRRDVNLVSNVLDTPELFWSEASLKDLYQACREYFEIGDRVDVLNQKLGATTELLDIIHDHLNNSAMIRITWIIIWLIVAACVVEAGEVIARLVVRASKSGALSAAPKVALPPSEALKILDQMMAS